MVNIPGAPTRIGEPHTCDPGLPIGLHLNLTAGCPVLPSEQVPHLVGAGGAFLPFEAFLRHLFDAPLLEIRAEINAQARLLIDCGVTFDHNDYHQHTLALNDSLFGLVVKLAEAYHVPVRQPVSRLLSSRFKFIDLSNLGKASREIGSVFMRNPHYVPRFLRQIYAFRHLRGEAAQLGAPDWFINAFFREPTLANFSNILRNLPAGLSELMFHPALDQEELYTKAEGYRAEPARELVVLLNRAEVDRQAFI